MAVEKLMETSERYHSSEKDEGNLQRYQQLSPEKLHDPLLLVEMGKIHYQKKEYDTAIHYASKALALDPANADALNILSYCHYYKNNDAHAIEYCTQWIACDIQNSAIPLALLNRIYEKKAQRQQEEKLKTERERARLEEAAKFREKLEQMIQQYTHTLANTLLPHTILNVASELKERQGLQKYASILFRAYQAELFIYRQGELLEIKHTGDAQKFRTYIRQSCLSMNSAEEFTTLENILDAVTARVITRLLHQGKLASVRQTFLRRQGLSIEEWQASFEREVYFNAQKTALQWANDHLARIHLSISPAWKNLKFKTGDESYAEALLWGHFGELLFNALKYTDHLRDEWVTMTFEEDERYLMATWENPRPPAHELRGWRSKGLESIRNDLEMLNQNEAHVKTLDLLTASNRFSAKLYFAKHVFAYKSKIRRRRKEKP